jgi:hypothetical protein
MDHGYDDDAGGRRSDGGYRRFDDDQGRYEEQGREERGREERGCEELGRDYWGSAPSWWREQQMRDEKKKNKKAGAAGARGQQQQQGERGPNPNQQKKGNAWGRLWCGSGQRWAAEREEQERASIGWGGGGRGVLQVRSGGALSGSVHL